MGKRSIVSIFNEGNLQQPFQVPKMEESSPTAYKLYGYGLCKGSFPTPKIAESKVPEFLGVSPVFHLHGIHRPQVIPMDPACHIAGKISNFWRVGSTRVP